MSDPTESSHRQTFSELAREHHRMALLYARNLAREEHTARDLAQDAFLLAWQHWSRFDVTRDFGSWLRGIIRNKWREYCRKNSRLSFWDDEALARLEDTVQEMPESGFFDHLKDCLDRLPETLLKPILAHYYQDLSTAEAAEQLNASEPATRKRLQRARASLKTCLTAKAVTL